MRRSARRAARRALGRDLPSNAHATPPARPIGGKFELTYACNLRCGFCYTDSPRHTLQRTPELSDSEWLRATDALIELGAIEAVITGGEPLLREELTIEVCRRLAEAGLGVTLNSNGWFIDDPVAGALARAPGLHVHVSIDGPGPDLHDGSRGVPGSWRRAIGGIDALIRHGVAVHAVHVVTRRNLDSIEATLEQLRVLGVPAIRVTPVIEVGAAARDGGWRVGLDRIERAVAGFRERAGDSVIVALQSGEGAAALINRRSAPAALLVRPNGNVRTDSLNPFGFGHAIKDGLGTCWERVREHWRDPEIDRWRGQIGAPEDLPRAATVAYLDDEPAVGRATPPADGDARSAPLPAPVAHDSAAAAAAREAIPDPGAHVAGLALGRRYRAGEVRVSGDPGSRLIRRRSDGRIWKLNRSASISFDALSGGTPADAVAALAADVGSSGVERERLRDDVLTVAYRLARDGLVLPEAAREPAPTGPGADPDLPQLAAG